MYGDDREPKDILYLSFKRLAKSFLYFYFEPESTNRIRLFGGDRLLWVLSYAIIKSKLYAFFDKNGPGGKNINYDKQKVSPSNVKFVNL